MNFSNIFSKKTGLMFCVAVVFLVVLYRDVLYRAPLPHHGEFHDITAAEAISRLRQEPLKDVVFAASDGLGEGLADFNVTDRAYNELFDRKEAEIAAVLGRPSYEGDWTEDSFPIFAIGHRIAVWGSGKDTIYLRIEEEKEGIEVSLLTPQSPNSNHDEKSYYREERRHLKSERH